jgi:uncharacterized protein (TIGR02996 family)
MAKAKAKKTAAPKNPAYPAKKKPAAKKPAANKAPSVPVGGDLLAQIISGPEDRALRLVYADALSDAGDPRGALITQQCALADLDPLDARYAPTLASVNRLIAAHGKQWLGDFRPAIWPGLVDRLSNAKFEGGFLKRIAMTTDDIATQWAKLRAREPVKGVELIVSEWIEPQYRTLPQAADFEILKVSPTGWFTGNSFANVLAWGMPKLRELDIAGCDVGSTGAQLIANMKTDLAEYYPDHVEPPHFADGQLRALGLAGTNIGDGGLTHLIAARHLAGLEALDLGRCNISEEGMLVALRDSETMRGLRKLSLAGNSHVGAMLGVLAGWADRLVELKLPQSTNAAALRALFPKPSPKLRTFEISSAKDLAGAKLADVAEALVHLDIGTTSLGDDRFIELIGAPSLRRLVHLHANGCSLSDDVIGKLPFERLVSLDVSSNKLTDAGMKALASWSGLANVTFLRIGNNRKVTAAGLDALVKAPHFQPAELDVGKLADPKLVAKLRERFGETLIVRD